MKKIHTLGSLIHHRPRRNHLSEQENWRAFGEDLKLQDLCCERPFVFGQLYEDNALMTRKTIMFPKVMLHVLVKAMICRIAQELRGKEANLPQLEKSAL
ncbi:hypothetical protein NDU88_003508 [Pleurodeles waltl]|uniref:Uncharacterized protein n=1 Tax=Pleurodeles waltl TaxID=8319 RepID=A0AAV7RD34_PLEWA|nr:hypothetical protein NDU88_003508 [Pleurodeles waltl]